MTTLPKALLKELPHYTDEGRKYTAKEAVLALLANNPGGVTTKEMMIYVYKLTKVVMRRTYLYQMLYRLRKAGLIADGERCTLQTSSNGTTLNAGTKRFAITEEGKLAARPYVEVPSD